MKTTSIFALIKGMTRRIALVPAMVLSLCATRAARCEEAAPEPALHYGGQILLVDAISIGAIVAGMTVGGGKLAGISLGGLIVYELGGPIVHWAHRRGPRGFGSLGLRMFLPLAGAAAGLGLWGATAGSCTGEFCGLNHAIIGAAILWGVGILAASALDIAWLAHDDVAADPEPRASIVFTGQALALRGRF
jgi:hypothetical protein